MAEQICPNCKVEAITWSMDEGEKPLTKWVCRNCSYVAYEDESFERVCINCGTKNEMRLDDGQKQYWWCCKCNTVKIIN